MINSTIYCHDGKKIAREGENLSTNDANDANTIKGGRFYETAGENSDGVNFQPLRHLETEREIADAMDFIEVGKELEKAV